MLIILFWAFLQTEWGQNWLAQQVTSRLSKDLRSRISISKVKIGLFNLDKLDLQGVLVEDQKKDTLLYAGNFQVRITDWFIFKNKAVLKYVGLSDAVININRNDSIWNYQFLADYFASDGSTSKKKESGIQFNLQKIILNNVSFNKMDAWEGNNLIARIGSLDLDADQISITNQVVDIRNVSLLHPYFSIMDYKPKDTSAFSAPVSAGAKNQPGWKFLFKNVSISDGRFRLDKNDLISSMATFDGQHIDFNSINGTLKTIGWSNDTIRGTISLSARERCGLIVRSLKAKTTIYPEAMIFDNLHIETNRSIIDNYYSMRYKDISDMDDFIHAVNLEANFNKATISSDDIAFFAPEAKTWKKNIKVQGRIKGTIDALTSKDLEIWAGNKTYIHGAVSLVGLPDINETLIHIEAKDLHTTYDDAVSFIPSIRSVDKPGTQ